MSTARDERRNLLEQLIGKDVASGRFQITHLLGFGGMGAVYGAIQTNMGRNVALKLIPTHDPTTVARFEREALTISKLRHPNTITVFDYGQTEDHFLFLSMEMLEGKTLTEVISEGPRSAIDTVHIASQICRSLSEAHRNGIVHRDVKPDNIILIEVDDDPNVVKVLDFGIAKAVFGEDDVQLTGDGRIVGTPRYMSPEQILAEPVDLRCDIYALGCIMFEMLCGAPPFQQKSTTALMISHTQDPPPAFAQRLDTGVLQRMPSGLERVVRKALAKNPNNRQQSCDELRIELENALAGMIASEEFDVGPTVVGPDASNQRPITQNHYYTNPNQSAVFNTASGEIPGFTGTGSPLVGKKKSNLLPLIIGGLLFLLIAILGFVFLSQDNKKEGLVVESKSEKKEKTIPIKEVKKSDGSHYVRFEIKTKPAGVSVLDQGALLGKTPYKMPVRKTKDRVSLTLSKPGYEPLPILLLVDAEKENTIKTYELIKKAGEKKTIRKVRNKDKRKKKTPVEKKQEEKTPEKTQIKMLDEGKRSNVEVLE